MTEAELLHAEEYEAERERYIDKCIPNRINNPRLWWRCTYESASRKHYGRFFHFVLNHEPFWKRIYKAHCEGAHGQYIDFKDVIPSDWNRRSYIFGEDDDIDENTN